MIRRIRSAVAKQRSVPLENRNKVVIGAVALVLIAAFILVLLQIQASGPGKQDIRAQFAQAAGVSTGDGVNIAGVQVGRVTSTELSGTFVTVGMEVDSGVALGEATEASIKLTTLLGSRYVEIRPAGEGSLPDATIPLPQTHVPYDLQQVLQNATVTFEQVDAEKIGQSMTTLATQLDDTPQLIPQVLDNIENLSAIIADRRDQIGALLTSTEQLTTVVREQQASLGDLVTRGERLLRAVLQRRVMIQRMLDASTEVITRLRRLVVDDRDGLNRLVSNLEGLLGSLERNDALLRNTLEVLPIPVRNFANTTGTGNEVDFTSSSGPLIDSWMCAISKQAGLVNLPPYFKDCR
ncbi:MlaD family protein [Gordonia sp. LSe1-13]|uniref:MlaD family protein n=1 Tax=Gordonia sesuvii TaxID=3116777 RepID=A0ABU7M9T7_9ACTN|nr:MlaD family protein [Gordonia sp. LSe1-13]